MTNQEAIEAIKLARSQVEWDYPMDYAAAFDKAIEALKQEPVIYKIRAEIEAYAIHATDEKQRIAFNACLNLIDHYTELKPN